VLSFHLVLLTKACVTVGLSLDNESETHVIWRIKTKYWRFLRLSGYVKVDITVLHLKQECIAAY